MKKLVALVALASNAALACDCYGPQSFCGIQAPPPPQWEYAPPDHNILGVKLGEVSYGMDVLVLQVFSGDVIAGDTIRVWGDCGLLCRRFVDTWADGDTVLWGINDVDYMGNWECPGGGVEQAGEYMITICGLNWLSYTNGLVSGQVTAEVEQTITIAEFSNALSGCLAATSIAELPANDPLYWNSLDRTISWRGGDPPTSLRVFDAAGRAVMERAWRGEPIMLSPMAPGVFVIVVYAKGHAWRKRIVLDQRIVTVGH